MKIALFGRHHSNTVFLKKILGLISQINNSSIELLIHENIYYLIEPHVNFKSKPLIFGKYEDFSNNVDLMISLGGDGTLLDAATYVRDSGIPILGVNIGKLGFLSSVSIDEAEDAVKDIINNNYKIDKRSLVRLEEPSGLFGELNYGLNELYVTKRDTSTMIKVSAYVDDLYLNTYWADGLIIATPTGSTGYSLSCGGPIISPNSNNFVINPIATHNLTVRPIVIPDNCSIKLRIEEKNKEFLCVIDSRIKVISSPKELLIKKANFSINLINIGDNDFFKTIQNKLSWGFDKRN